ncbi:MAG: hypothetical protein K2X64_10900, partial [Rhodocyclaceae bacterium]|nr:hypothetical protein [Rhodocyclaceae bacterium]
MKRSFSFAALPLLFALTLSGCDQLGVETPAQTLARQEAEGKAGHWSAKDGVLHYDGKGDSL